MKIGIFGGSFNPPHKMHKKIALDLIHDGYVDEVIYVPTGNKYNKKDLLDVEERLAMLKIMTHDNGQLKVSAYEVKNVLTYTYQTLDYFKSIYPNDDIYFICGTDNLREITTWKNYAYILNNYKILVIQRDNDDIEDLIKNIYNDNIIITKISTRKVSSTKIRDALRRNASYSTLSKYLEAEVIDYIKKRNLYFAKEKINERGN